MSTSETSSSVGGTSRLFTGALVLAVIALSVLVTLLAKQNRELKVRIGQLSTPTLPPSLATGQTVGPLKLMDSSGTESVLAFDGSAPATLILVGETGCPHCEKSLPVWEAAIQKASNARLRVVAIELDGTTPEKLRRAGSSLAFFGPVGPRKDTWLREVPIVPAAFLVDARGVILRSWLGELGEHQSEDAVFALIGAGLDATGQSGP